MTVAVAIAAAKTSTGNQDITTSDLGGATPKAAIFLYSRCAADGTINANSGVSIGFTDGTNQCAIGDFTENGGASFHHCANYFKWTRCVTALNAPDPSYSASCAVHSEAAVVGFIANGVRINWTTATADAWLLTVILFAGSDWSVQVGHLIPGPASPPASVATGFQPDAVLMIGSVSTGAANGGDGTLDSARVRFGSGATAWTAGTPHGIAFNGWHWAATRQAVLSVGYGPNANAGFYEVLASPYGITLDRTATGFTTAGTPQTDYFGYIALKWTGGAVSVGSISVSTASGAQSFVGFGLQPSFVLLFLTQAIDGTAWRFGYSALTTTKIGGFALGAVVDTAAINGTQDVHHSVAFTDKIRMLDVDGTENIRATLTSFDANGLTLNFSNPPEAGCTWGYFAVGAGSAPVATERLFGTIID